MKQKILLTMILTVAMAGTARADINQELADAFGMYKKGAYAQAVEALSKIHAKEKKDLALVEYWKGLCSSRLQQFDQAATSYQKAAAYGVSLPDFEYEYGQALYAEQKLKPAREWFRKSQAKGFKAGASGYYVGFISQMLEEYPTALEAYAGIQRLPDDSDHVKQAAMLQTAEIRLAKAETIKDELEKKRRIHALIIPEFNKVVEYASNTPASQQAEYRVAQLQSQYPPEMSRMRNGVPIAEKTWYLKVSEDPKYDSNVISQADQSTTQVSNAGSYIIKTSAFGKYEYIVDGRWVVAPELGVSHTYHLNRDTPTVFKNDALSMTPALRLRHEHRFMKEPAAFLFDLEFNHMLEDVLSQHQFIYYSRYYNITAGERAKLIGNASTALLANLKFYENYDTTLNAVDPGLTLNQNFKMERYTLSMAVAYDYSRARLSTNDRATYRFSPSYNRQNIIWGVDIDARLDASLVNNPNTPSRGLEKIINPTLTLSKDWSRNFVTNLSYSYTRQISNDKANYDYKKNVFGLGLSYQM